MPLRPINSEGGFSTGPNANVVIDANSNVTASTLSVSGESNLGNIANVTLTGGSNGQFIKTDGTGNISFANLSNSSNSQILFNSNGVITGSNNLTFVNNVIVANGGIDVEGDLYLSGNSAIRAAGNITVTAPTNFSSNITGGNANITNIRGDVANFNTGNISSLVTVSANLGNVTSLKILGGNNGQFLQTDGTGNLAWSTAGGGGAVANQASINFTANSNASNQEFTSGSLAVFPSNAYASVFKNGVLVDVADYTIANGALVINTYLQTGDSITVGALLSPEATPNGSNQQIQFNNEGNMGASAALKFDSDADTLILTGTQRYVDDSGRYAGFRAFNLDSNVTYNLPRSDGSNGQVLRTDGNGNMSWSSAGSGTAIISGNSNVNIPEANGNVTVSVGGVSNVLVVSNTGANVTGTFAVSGVSNLGAVGNVRITGGSNGQVISTDGNGNLSFISVSSSSISNGNSNVNIPSANGNVTISSAGNANIVVVTGTGANITGTANVTGNANVGNLGTAGQITATGNITGGNLMGPLANGNSNVRIAAANGNVAINSGGNNIMLLTANTVDVFGRLSVSGNLTVTGVATSTISGPLSVLGNLSGGNISTGGAIFATGNVTAGNANLGNLASANFVTGTLTTAAQPNITSVGTLTSLTTSGTATIGTGSQAITISPSLGNIDGGSLFRINANGIVSNYLQANSSFRADLTSGGLGIALPPVSYIGINGAGSNDGKALVANASGNIWGYGTLRWQSVVTGASGSNTEVQFNDGGGFAGSNGFTFNKTTNALSIAGSLTANSVTSNGNVDFTSSGNVSLGNVANVKLTGGNSGQYLQTDGNGNLSFATISSDGISNGNSNVSIPAANGNVNISSAGNANIVVVTGTGANITGTLDVTANISYGANYSGLALKSVPNGFYGAIYSTGVTANGNNYTLMTDGGASFLNAPDANSGVYIRVDNDNKLAVVGGGVTAYGNLTATGNLSAAAGTLSSLTSTGNIQSNANIITDNVISRTGTLTLSASGSNQDIDLKPTGTGRIDAWTARISNVADPTAAQDVATKAYVDAAVESLHVHDSCLAATPDTLANITAGTTTYDNGANGVGAYISTTGTFGNIDGVNVATSGTRILVKSEANAAWNGIYTYTNATAVTRATDFNTSADAAGGDFVFVTSGNTYADTGWVQTTDNVVIGTSNIAWTQFSGAGQYTAGTGLTLNGTQFSISNTTVTAASYGNGDRVATFTVNSQGQLTAAANTVITANAANLTGNTLNSSVVTSSLTSLGTLTGLTVSGVSNLGNSGDVKITGGSNGQYLQTDGTGNLVWANAASGNISMISNGTSNVNIATANGNVTIAANGVTQMTISGSNVTIQDDTVVEGEMFANFVTSRFTMSTDNVTSRTMTGGQKSRIQMYGNSGVIFYNQETGYSDYPMLTVKSGGMTVGVNANFLFDAVVTNANFTVSNGVSNLGAIGNVRITGGSNGNVLTTDGAGNLSFSALSTIGNGTSNVTIPTANGNVNISSNGVANVLVVTNTSAILSDANGRFVGSISGNVYSVLDSNISITSSNTYGANANLNALTFDLTGANNGNMTLSVTPSGTAGVDVPYGNFRNEVNTPLVYNSNLTLSTTAAGATITANTGGATRLLISNVGANITGNLVVSNTLTANGVINFTNSANVSLGAVGNVKITGGTSGQFLSTDGSGGLSFASVSTSSISNGNSNVSIPAANGNVTISAAGNANVVTVTGTGANVTGTLNATGNVSFTGANISLGANGNVRITGGSNGQYLQTNGSGGLSWVTVSGGSAITNGNSNVTVAANSNVTVGVAGNANIVTVTGTGANVSGTANITGNVALGSNLTVAGIANITGNTNISGNATVTGNLTAGNLIGHLANGNSSVKIATANGNVTITAAGNANIVTVTGTGANVAGTLNVTGNVAFSGADVNLGNVSNLEITGGGLNGQVLTSNGANGVAWSNTVIMTSQFLRGSRQANQTVSSGGAIQFDTSDYSLGAGATLDTATGNITLQPGTYILRGQVPAASLSNTTAGMRPSLQWHNTTGNSYIGSIAAIYQSIDAAGFIASGGIAEAVITVSAVTNVQFRLRSIVNGTMGVGAARNSDFTGTQYPWFEVSSPGGQASGMVQYLYAKRSGNQTISAGNTWANKDIIFNDVEENSGLTYNANTGEVTLNAGVTYRITSGIQWGAAASYLYQYGVYNNANVLLSGVFENFPPTAGSNNLGPNQVDFIYTPSSTTTVKIRNTANTTALSGEVVRGDLGGTYLSVQSITTVAYQATGGWTVDTAWTFGGTTTAPTMATTNNRRLAWKVDGKTMSIKGFYTATSSTGTAAGSGEYLLTLPGSYQVDTTVTGTASVGNITSLPVGQLTIDTSSQFRGAGQVIPYDSTRVKFIAWYTSDGGVGSGGFTPISSTFYNLNTAARYNIFFTAEIPIL